MNFLGHLFLSGDDDETIVGNFIADHVKGKIQHAYAPGVLRGIQLHRAIDHFTDHHPVVLQGVRRLNGDYGRYGTVIIDMYYDHFLASMWPDYHQMPIGAFTHRVYQRLLDHLEIMPERTQRMLPHMVQHNWLASYAYPEGLNRALSGMSGRAKFASGMENATGFLMNHYREFQHEFQLFMPDVIAFTDQWKQHHPIP